jgi:hypothetical protein
MDYIRQLWVGKLTFLSVNLRRVPVKNERNLRQDVIRVQSGSARLGRAFHGVQFTIHRKIYVYVQYVLVSVGQDCESVVSVHGIEVWW